MRNWKLQLVAETMIYLIFAICLEIAIEYPCLTFHHGKDAGLFSELEFLILITLTSSILWFRKHLLYLIGMMMVSPLIIIFSYLVWFFIFDDGGIGFLIIYITFLTILKFSYVTRLEIE